MRTSCGVYLQGMILLTGATGFLGQHLLKRLLADGFQVKALVRNPENRDLLSHPQLTWVSGDIMQIPSLLDAMDGVETVFHAAAVVSFARVDYPMMKQVNVVGTRNVVDCALEKGVKKLVHISSTSATGRIGKGETVVENTPWKPGKHHLAYGMSKRDAEFEVHRGVAEGLPAVMLNPATIIGPGDWTQGTPKLFRMVDKGLPFYLPAVNGFVGVNDVVEGVVRGWKSDFVAGERFLLVTESMSQKAFLGLLADALHVKAPRFRFPPYLGNVLGFFSEIWAKWRGTTPLITRDSMRQARRKVHYRAAKSEEFLGMRYTPMSQVIHQTTEAYRADFPK